MAPLQTRWIPWPDLRHVWEELRTSWGLPRTYATASFFLDFFHELPRLSVEVLTVEAGGRRLAMFPLARRKRLGVYREGHALPWNMPGGVWISPAVPEARRMEILEEIQRSLRRFQYFTFLDRYGTVGLAWSFPRDEVVHHVLPAETVPSPSARRTVDRARDRYTVRTVDAEAFAELYPLYVAFQKMKRTPHLDRVFFDTFFRTIPEENRIALGLLRDGAWAGGLLGVGDGEEALLHTIFLDPVARKEGGFHLLVVEAIRLAREKGFRQVDLGHHPSGQPGLDLVKNLLGAEEERVFLHVFPAWMFNLRGAGNRVWYRRRVHP